MKAYAALLYLSLTLFLFNCKQTEPQKETSGVVNETYNGPIIDMHIHAFTDGEFLFGLTHPPTLRDETYEGVETGEELKKQVKEINGTLKKWNKKVGFYLFLFVFIYYFIKF